MIELFLLAYSLPPIAEVRFTPDYFSAYPQQISIGKDAPVLYSRQPGYYAVHSQEPKASVATPTLLLNEGKIAVFTGEPKSAITDTISPVYRLQGGSLAVPTGLIFIRFAENVDVESQKAAINQAGYEITEKLAYAPHAAWLRAKSGKMSDAFQEIRQLEAIPNVENVEPQMLMERRQR
ncbi:hypothetical protein H6G41_28575 [Tolypothrix sp. FACHB-123]|uniref:hypothetical protein n=1 Tax=Tolypothrix sp. FACHB-123 TaxID=2692868 RepID=UPI0016883BCC|nr:hypothetical protein [Tolypothrix sp. FACHB-123]MBD2358521.1 hypothetical protein [Tolypothrix sp. FACHB-123]